MAINPIPSDTSVANSDVPALTPAVIRRAAQAAASATDPRTLAATERALRQGDALATGQHVTRMAARWRQRIVRFCIARLMRVRVEGAEHIPAGGAIIAPNHLSHFDPFIVLAYLPTAPYCTLVGDDRALFNTWWKRLILRIVGGVIPIGRRWKEERAVVLAADAGRADLRPLADAIIQHVPDTESVASLRRLDRIVTGLFAQGESLLIYPEGRLGSREGHLHTPLKRGTVLYALRSGVPIVPVAIIGVQDLYLGKPVIVRFGPPLHFPLTPHPKSRDAQAALDTLTAAMQALLPTDYMEPMGRKLGRVWLKRLFL